MNEEEKKALETIKEELQEQKQITKYYKGVLGVYSNGKVEILLKLIEKQQKEIERLKERQDYARLEKEQLLEDCISKDKIREKINKLKANDIEYFEHIAILEKLLEENNSEQEKI